MPHQGRGFSQYGVSGSPTKSKVTSCPGCRKPLPRCALCLMNMGTPVSNCPGKAALCVNSWSGCNTQVSICRHGCVDFDHHPWSAALARSLSANLVSSVTRSYWLMDKYVSFGRNGEVRWEGGLYKGEQTCSVQQLVHMVSQLSPRRPRWPYAQLVQVGLWMPSMWTWLQLQSNVPSVYLISSSKYEYAFSGI